MTYHELLQQSYSPDLILAYQRGAIQAARRPSISTEAFLGAYFGNGGNFPAAIAAAFLTFGGRHGPFEELMALWGPILKSDTKDFKPEDRIEKWVTTKMLDPTFRLPGFGNSFEKGPDPVWMEFQALLPREIISLLNAMMRGTQNGPRSRILHPNTATFTLLYAVSVPGEGLSNVWPIFLQTRLSVYSTMIL